MTLSSKMHKILNTQNGYYSMEEHGLQGPTQGISFLHRSQGRDSSPLEIQLQRVGDGPWSVPTLLGLSPFITVIHILLMETKDNHTRSGLMRIRTHEIQLQGLGHLTTLLQYVDFLF